MMMKNANSRRIEIVDWFTKTRSASSRRAPRCSTVVFISMKRVVMYSITYSVFITSALIRMTSNVLSMINH